MAHNSAHDRGSDSGSVPLDHMAAVQHLQGMVRDARALLTDPTVANLNDCRSRLEEAVQALHELQTRLSSGNFRRATALRAPLGALRADIARLSMLLDSAAAFHAGWVQLAASLVAGYTAKGTPGQPEPSRSVWLEV